MNLANNLKNAAFYFPDNIALIDGEISLTYKELDQESDNIAVSLKAMGVKPGAHIALCSPNSYQWVAFYFGVLKTGAVAITLPYTMTRDEMRYIIQDCKPEIIFTVKDRMRDFSRDNLVPVIISEGTDLNYTGLLEKSTNCFEMMARESDDTAVILYTGGTTGKPKGVILSHNNIMSSAFNVAHNERSGEKDVALCFLPLNHVFAQMHIMHSTIISAGGLVILPSFDMGLLLESIVQYNVTKLYSVPTVYIRLLSLSDLKIKLGIVRYCFSAAASMSKEVVREWKEKTSLNIYEAYGMTESASMVTFNHYHKHIVGSVGTPVNMVEVQIRDKKGKVLAKNMHGEICICGPNIMKGYLNRPEETKKAFWGKWFRSGDIGFLDDNSYLYITDRIKELIITGGENVSPREIEEYLYQREEIQECAVIGIPDKEYGEKVMAYIIPTSGRIIDPVDLKKFLKSRLSPFKIPKAFISVQELPKSPAGKLLKRELRKKVIEDKNYAR